MAPAPTAAQLARYAERFSQSATMRAFNARLDFPDGETVHIRLEPVLPAFLGGLGGDAVNGGVLAAIFDVAIGCTPALLDPTRRSATVQLSMNFLAPVRGASLSATAKVLRAGKRLVFAEATLSDARGQRCATCTGVVRVSEERWADGESPAVN